MLIDEKCAENAQRLGPIFRQHIMDIGSPLIQQVGVCFRCSMLVRFAGGLIA